MERGAKRVADDLKDKSTMYFNRFSQNLVMLPLRGFPRPGMLPRESCTALDVREEECNSARRKTTHPTFPPPPSMPTALLPPVSSSFLPHTYLKRQLHPSSQYNP